MEKLFKQGHRGRVDIYRVERRTQTCKTTVCLRGDAGPWTVRCVGCGGAALDDEVTWRVCKAAGITFAGVSYDTKRAGNGHFRKPFQAFRNRFHFYVPCLFCELLHFHWCARFVIGKSQRGEFSTEGFVLAPAGMRKAH